MTVDNPFIVESRLKKVFTDLDAARIMLDEGFYNQSLNRSYYAIFHAARAVLATQGLDFGQETEVGVFEPDEWHGELRNFQTLRRTTLNNGSGSSFLRPLESPAWKLQRVWILG